MPKKSIKDKINFSIQKETKDNFLSHFIVVFRTILLWEYGVVYGKVEGIHFTIWRSDLFTSFYYTVISGKIDEQGKVKVSLKINPIGKLIYFLFSVFIMSIFSALLFKEASNFDHYLVASVIVLIILLIVISLGYMGNKFSKSRSLRQFQEYLEQE